MSRAQGLNELMRDAVQGTTTVVERIHQSIASRPLRIAGFIPGFEDTAAKLEHLRRESTASTYESIRVVTGAVSGILAGATRLVEQGRERSPTVGSRHTELQGGVNDGPTQDG